MRFRTMGSNGCCSIQRSPQCQAPTKRVFTIHIRPSGPDLVYSGMPSFKRVPQPDIYLARSLSESWFGPWERLGKILDHSELPHHNARDHPDYEWGIEGAQLVELPDRRVLLNATCFLPEGERGSRQRVFFAVADEVAGPYRTVGPILDPGEPGENGHSTVIVREQELSLVYQSRRRETNFRWRYGIATLDLSSTELVA